MKTFPGTFVESRQSKMINSGINSLLSRIVSDPALERLANTYGSEITRINEELNIAQSQLSIGRSISVVVDFARSPANAWNSGESHYK